MDSWGRTITIANDDTIVALINSARSRLVAVSPALSKAVAEALCDRWRELGPEAVTVIIDVDPEVYRLGYGNFQALDILERTAASLGTMVSKQQGIRIGLLIADARTMIYSPTPLLIEAGPCYPDNPNAVLLENAPDQVLQELGHGQNGVKDRQIGMDKATVFEITAISQDLQGNPPQKFDIARTVRVFNAQFEFVEFELKGCYISRRRVPIPNDLMGLADDNARRLMKSSYGLIDDKGLEFHKQGEDKGNDSKKPKVLSETAISDKKNKITTGFLISLKGYGSVILRSNKDAFVEKVNELRGDVARYQEYVTEHITEGIESNLQSLSNVLLPRVEASPPERWRKFTGGNRSKTDLQRLLEVDLRKAFDAAKKSVVDEMRVNLVFKGVTYESLHDEAFLKIVQEAIPMLQSVADEFDAAKATGGMPKGS